MTFIALRKLLPSVTRTTDCLSYRGLSPVSSHPCTAEQAAAGHYKPLAALARGHDLDLIVRGEPGCAACMSGHEVAVERGRDLALAETQLRYQVAKRGGTGIGALAVDAHNYPSPCLEL